MILYLDKSIKLFFALNSKRNGLIWYHFWAVIKQSARRLAFIIIFKTYFLDITAMLIMMQHLQRACIIMDSCVTRDVCGCVWCWWWWVLLPVADQVTEFLRQLMLQRLSSGEHVTGRLPHGKGKMHKWKCARFSLTCYDYRYFMNEKVILHSIAWHAGGTRITNVEHVITSASLEQSLALFAAHW